MTTDTLITFLRGTNAVSSLLGAPVKLSDGTLPTAAVYKQVLPRAYKLPAIVVHRYNGVSDQDMAGPVNAREDNFQLDVYGDTENDCDALTNACRSLMTGLTGEVGSTFVMGTYLEQDRDMPFLPNADSKSLAFRSLLGYRVVSKV